MQFNIDFWYVLIAMVFNQIAMVMIQILPIVGYVVAIFLLLVGHLFNIALNKEYALIAIPTSIWIIPSAKDKASIITGSCNGLNQYHDFVPACFWCVWQFVQHNQLFQWFAKLYKIVRTWFGNRRNCNGIHAF